MSISDELAMRLTALSSLWSRSEAQVRATPTPDPEKPVGRVKSASVGAPEVSVGKRMDRLLEIEPNGRVKVRGYRRRIDGNWADWDEPING